jgi:hypothetical protein
MSDSAGNKGQREKDLHKPLEVKMQLVLRIGYPFPYPKQQTYDEIEADADAAMGIRLTLQGVSGLQWLHTVTVDFASLEACNTAHLATGWTKRSHHVLEAQTRTGDGYAHPAIVANRHVYCGFNLIED